jgi:hypothetical protein
MSRRRARGDGPISYTRVLADTGRRDLDTRHQQDAAAVIEQFLRAPGIEQQRRSRHSKAPGDQSKCGGLDACRAADAPIIWRVGSHPAQADTARIQVAVFVARRQGERRLKSPG